MLPALHRRQFPPAATSTGASWLTSTGRRAMPCSPAWWQWTEAPSSAQSNPVWNIWGLQRADITIWNQLSQTESGGIPNILTAQGKAGPPFVLKKAARKRHFRYCISETPPSTSFFTSLHRTLDRHRHSISDVGLTRVSCSSELRKGKFLYSI